MELSIFSLVPPALALLLVIVTKRVFISLGAGIIVGSLMLNDYNPLSAAAQVYSILMSIIFDYDLAGNAVTFGSVTQAVYKSGFSVNTWELYIILFLLLLGMMAALITRSGGSYAFGEWAQTRVKTRVGAQLLPVFLGIIIFIDDYFTSLTVGNVSRPLTDRHRISRAKLAYLVDSTAAPICVVAPISSWGAYIIAIIAGILTTHGVTQFEAMQAFMMMIPMNLYAIATIGLVFSVALFDLNIGPMKIHEQRARTSGELYNPSTGTVPSVDDTIKANVNGKVGDLVWPIVALIVGTVAIMLLTGVQNTSGEVTLLSIFENTDVAISLVLGGLFGLFIAFVLNMIKPNNETAMKSSIVLGIKSMLPAIYILIFAWTIIAIIEELRTGFYLASLIDGTIDPMYLPVILFIIAGIAAFATGTSWGTFGLLLPIAAEMAAVIDINLLLPMLASVLAGSIFGDHCSPISDTTILSSTGAGCYHMDHVVTQLPYALIAAGISIVGYLVLGASSSVLLGFVTTIILLVLAVIVLKRIANK